MTYKLKRYKSYEPGRAKVTVLTLSADEDLTRAKRPYKEAVYQGSNLINSAVFPLLKVTAEAVLSGEAS